MFPEKEREHKRLFGYFEFDRVDMEMGEVGSQI